MKTLIPLLMFLLLLSISLLGCGGTSENVIAVPIEVRNADNIGAMYFEIIYDSTVLEAVEVRADKLATGADSGYNKDTAGTLIVLVENAPKLNGDGALVKAFFGILNHNATGTLNIVNLQARNLTTLEYIEGTATAGSYDTATKSVYAPLIDFGN